MRVLIVDDDPISLDIMSRVLESAKYQVIEAKNGEHGYNLAIQEAPDLIITDYHMPILNGKELVRAIKNTPSVCAIPIIAMTADIYAGKAFMSLGCRAYLAKPIRKGSLLRTISSILDIT